MSVSAFVYRSIRTHAPSRVQHVGRDLIRSRVPLDVRRIGDIGDIQVAKTGAHRREGHLRAVGRPNARKVAGRIERKTGRQRPRNIEDPDVVGSSVGIELIRHDPLLIGRDTESDAEPARLADRADRPAGAIDQVSCESGLPER